jgi:hypothetical protein
MTRPRARLVLTLAVFIGLLATMTGQSHAQFVLYDNFDSGSINPQKWNGFIFDGGFAAPSAEWIRTIETGQLHLTLVSYGGTTSDTGGVFAGQGLNMKDLGVSGGTGFITGIKALVTILAAEAEACAANASPEKTDPRVQLSGRFFNDGTSTGVNDQAGDVQAFLIIVKDGFGNNRINAGLQRCTNAACSSQSGIGGSQFTTTWLPNVALAVKLVWQNANGKFRFVVNSEVQDIFYPVGLTAAGPPVRDTKQVFVLNQVENCTAGRKKAKMDALIDQVKVSRQP